MTRSGIIDSEFATSFARAWLEAWNDHDLDAILSHYAEDIVFHSPRIRLVTGENVDGLLGKPELRAYWRKALDQSRELYFELDQLYVGSDVLTILYTNHRSQSVAETFIFDRHRLVVESCAAYA